MPTSLNAPRGSKPRSDAKPVEPSAPAPITPRAVNPEDAAAAAAVPALLAASKARKLTQ